MVLPEQLLRSPPLSVLPSRAFIPINPTSGDIGRMSCDALCI